MNDPTQTKLGVQNTKRSSSKVRRLSPEQLGIPVGPGAESQDEEERWEALRSAAADVDPNVGVAVRTADGDIVTGTGLSKGSSHDVHALEMAVWKGYEASRSPIVDVAVVGQSSDVPCGRCLQVLADYAKDRNTTVQVTDGESISEYSVAELII